MVMIFFNSVYYLPVEDDKQKRVELEQLYISKYQPKLNNNYDMTLRMFDPDINECLYDIKIKLPKDQVFDESWFK